MAVGARVLPREPRRASRVTAESPLPGAIGRVSPKQLAQILHGVDVILGR
jgi:hypothetical protein